MEKELRDTSDYCIECGNFLSNRHSNRCYECRQKKEKERKLLKQSNFCIICGASLSEYNINSKKCNQCKSYKKVKDKKVKVKKRSFEYDGILYKSISDFYRRKKISDVSCGIFVELCNKCGSINGALKKLEERREKHITIEKCNKLANDRGGKFLNIEVNGAYDKLQWQCHNGHIFEKTYYDVFVRGSWCSQCTSIFYKEELCRAILEALFGSRFPKGFFFDWLVNDHGNQMESDGYCKEHNIAFEYHGIQHFKSVGRFKNNLEQRQRDDKRREELYKEHGIKYIEITHRVAKRNTLKIDERVRRIRKYILFECSRLGIEVPYPDAEIDVSKIYTADKWRYKEIKEDVERNGMQLESKFYIGTDSKYDLICSNGHRFSLSYSHLKREKLVCPICFEEERIKKGNERVKRAILEHGGEIIEGEYRSGKSKLMIRCKEGHEWETSCYSIIKGSWCSECYNPGIKVDYAGEHFENLVEFCSHFFIRQETLHRLMEIEGWNIERAADYLIYGIGKRKDKEYKCELCGKLFYIKAGASGNRKYCIDCIERSKKLRYKKYAKQQKEERHKRKKEKGWFCIECGKEIIGIDIHGRRKTCDDCKNRERNGCKKWTEDEDKILLDNADTLSTVELGELLPGRSIEAIGVRRLKLGIRLREESIEWSKDELEVIREHGSEMFCGELQGLLPKRSVGAIGFKRKQMGIYLSERKKKEQRRELILNSQAVTRKLDHSLTLEDLDYITKQVLLGSVFGGGSIYAKGSSHILSVGRDNEAYLDWKMSRLSIFEPRRKGKLKFETPKHSIFSYLYSRVYSCVSNRMKQVLFPVDLLDQLGDLGWLVWYLDQGCYNAGNMNLSVGRALDFGNILDEFERFYSVRLKRSKGRQKLLLGSVRDIILPRFCSIFRECMFPGSIGYKLGL